MRSAGYDPEDVLQEVFRGLLARNQGTCPFDPRKSSFGHYVYMVCSCVLSNYHRKQNRVRQFEQCGLPTYQDGHMVYDDASQANTATHAAQPTITSELVLFVEAADDLVDYILDHPQGGTAEARLAVRVLPLLIEGVSRAQMAARLEVGVYAVGHAIAYLRRVAREWRES